jgi:hypothetical protein
MTKRQFGVGAVITILIVIGIVVLSRHGSAPKAPAENINSDELAAKPREVSPLAKPSAATHQSPPVSGILARPTPDVAARNIRRSRLAGTLGPLGASEQMITRLANGDIVAVMTELKQHAQKGDASASNVLDYMAHLTCAFAESNGEGSPYHQEQVSDANALPAADAEWMGRVMQERNADKKRWTDACQQALDKADTDRWVAAAAAQGDPASHYLLFMFGRPPAGRDGQLLQAAAGGYSWAEFGLASRIIGGNPIAAGESGGTGPTQNAGDLLRAAAVELPDAEGQLAICELNGCPGVDADISSAVTHAREAAQRGSFDAMLEIGPQLPVSQMDPDEVSAWNLVYASLEKMGCAGQAINAKLMKSVSYTLNSPTLSANARTLADAYWKDYGGQILANLGCT